MNALAAHFAAVALAIALDLVVGDPQYRWHPVRLLGSMAAGLERWLRRTRLAEGAGGLLLAVVVCAAAGFSAVGISRVTASFGPVAAVSVDALLIYFALAGRALADEGLALGRTLGAGDLTNARAQLSHLVGRDTHDLDEAGAARAAIETLGENSVDALVAPVFWAALLGPAGAWVHKAASTLDSMVGYRNERYAKFGTASARLDDALAFVPARVAIPVTALSAAITGLDPQGALLVGVRDRLKHTSPNSAHGEAAFAGALGVSLGGEARYAGVSVERPVLGAGAPAPGAADVTRAGRLLLAVELLLLASAAGVAVALVASQ